MNAPRFTRVLTGLILLLATPLPGPFAAGPAELPRKIVLIAGPKSHGPAGNGIHDYGWSAQLLTVMLENSNLRERVQVEFHPDGWPSDPSALDGAAALMIISDGRDGDLYSEALHLESPARVAQMRQLIERGCGLVTFHFSTFTPDAYAPEILNWTGGYFDWESDGQREWYSAIQTLETEVQPDARHPINRGVTPFIMKEEFYFNLRFNEDHPRFTPIWRVPALPERPGNGNVVAWAIERDDGGRGFGTTCGHFYDNWKHEQFRRMILNAIAWTAHVEIPDGGVQARFYSQEEILAALEKRSAASSAPDPRAVEDAAARAALPEFITIPAAPPDELTPAVPEREPETGANWPRSHGGNSNRRFSPLNQINRHNVHKLEVAWTYHSADGKGNIQCNPVVVDGVLFAPTAGNAIVALDAATGSQRWRFQAPDRPAFRGLTFWRGDHGEQRLLFNSGDYLWALNPGTGRPIASFGTNGRLHTGHFRVAPAIFERTVLIAGFDRDVTAYDIITGSPLWTFHTVPHPGEPGHDTWNQPGHGANCWGGTALDAERGIFYLTTGSPKPNFSGVPHHGRNLHSNCLIALDARTGQLLWSFQEIRHDIWDLDIPAPPILTTIVRDNRKVDVVAALSKMGNTILLDRVTGKPVFPFRLKRAPASKLPGEWTWPYQPDLELPEPFARQVFSTNNVTNLSPESRDYVLDVLRTANFGWFEPFELGKRTIFYSVHGGAEWTGGAADPSTGRLYVSANEIPWIVNVFPIESIPRRAPDTPPSPGEQIYLAACASCHGADRRGIGTAPPLLAMKHRFTENQIVSLLKTGRGAMPAAPDMTPEQSAALLEFLFDHGRTSSPGSSGPNGRPQYASSLQKLLDPEGYPGSRPPWGTLNCIDLNTGKLLWKVPLGEHAALTARGIPKTGTENFGGPIVTAGGLVFCAGTRDKKVRAFDAATGDELWSHELPYYGSAPPTTYRVGGRQFIVVPAAGGGKLLEDWFDLPSPQPQTILKGGEPGDVYIAFALPE